MRTGLITYHSAYNFDSALQAYATQQALQSIGCPAALLNYRMQEQRDFYEPLYRTKYGPKVLLKDLTQLPCAAERRLRRERFEKFFSERFTLTPEAVEPEDVYAQWKRMDTVISGSDQIWNKHSCELAHNDWRYMDPYLLKGYEGKKVSYASSVGSMKDEELQRILPALRQFDVLSFRESASAEKMANILDRPAETVLDPTFLLTHDEWIEHLHLKKQKDTRYFLAYFLGLKQFIKFLPALSKIAKKYDCSVKVVTPFIYLPYPDRRIEYHPEYGPIEFLNALYNAEAVVTDSYHGTILSVNFGKEFYSICKNGGAEFRKTDILERLGLLDRVITDPAVMPDLALPPIDHDAVHAKLNALRRHSINYLKSALTGSEQ